MLEFTKTRGRQCSWHATARRIGSSFLPMHAHTGAHIDPCICGSSIQTLMAAYLYHISNASRAASTGREPPAGIEGPAQTRLFIPRPKLLHALNMDVHLRPARLDTHHGHSGTDAAATQPLDVNLKERQRQSEQNWQWLRTGGRPNKPTPDQPINQDRNKNKGESDWQRRQTIAVGACARRDGDPRRHDKRSPVARTCLLSASR